MLASSMLIFGTIGIFRRYIPLPSGLLAFSRGAIGAVFLGLFLKCRGAWKQKQKAGSGEGSERGDKSGNHDAQKSTFMQALPRKTSAGTMLLLILSGALIGVNWILLFEAYNILNQSE